MPLLEGAFPNLAWGTPHMSQRSVCCVNVDGRYALRNVPKTDSGIYPLVAHVRRSTRLSLCFSPAGQRSRITTEEGETGNEASTTSCHCYPILATPSTRAQSSTMVLTEHIYKDIYFFQE